MSRSDTLDPVSRLRRVHDRLEDDLSRLVFSTRMDYLLTGSPLAFAELVDSGAVAVREGFTWQALFNDVRRQAETRDIVIYGAGGCSGFLLQMLREGAQVEPKAFCDRNTALTKPLPVLDSTAVVADYVNGHPYTFCIGTEVYFDEIRDALMAAGVRPKHILGGRGDLSRQYFDPDIVQLREHEVFVDGGALDLATSLQLLQWQRGNGGTATCLAFEPDATNGSRARELIASGAAANCELVPLGLWSTRDTLAFNSASSGMSHLGEGGNTTIEVTDLDSWLGDRSITFMKLDIEGAEQQALAGAKQTILRDQPILTLAAYHLPDDLLVIPEFAAQTVPDHHWFLRHHSIYPVETVFYALPADSVKKSPTV